MIAHHLHIFPNLALFVRVAKQISRMKCRHHLYAQVIVKMPAYVADRHLCIEQILRSGRTEDDDHFWTNDRDLSQEKRLAYDRLVRFRCTISRRPAAVYIANANILASQPDALDDLRQKLPGPSDKRLALRVLIGTRSLAYKHQIGIEIPNAVNNARASKRTQLAPRAIRSDLSTDLFDRLARFRKCMRCFK